MTSLKTSIKTITYLSDIGCLEIQGASLLSVFGFEKFGEDIQALFDKYPVSKLFYASIGFPERWNEERLFFLYK
ncbi:hypothetical protein DBZ87_04965 [Salmonella enterica subsp. enterica serovar Enteritidis]|nr:hypothetical protein [Salmonella enterica subsp. enterica serovar Enteritidis]ECU0177105.1 hypothetical protein [Salmonella enterica subsp. enterica serovar Enteritidis]EGW2476140.1 hypothetical protein [Salmonella enterica]EGW3303991.1 hypothetical protein [Salmonella enterica subsp. enterica serovar Enteritidis]TAD04916.1 hypothetical protein DBZ87_04965 [Salmonella enterica subsp. enterica serovar Enteritidis]